MKTLALLSLLVSPVALAEEAPTATTPPKTEETVTLSEEATAPLFERVRGAHLRAQQNGKVASSASPMTVSPMTVNQ